MKKLTFALEILYVLSLWVILVILLGVALTGGHITFSIGYK